MSNLSTAGNYLPGVGLGAGLPCPAKPPQSRTAPQAGVRHPPPLSIAAVPVPGVAPRHPIMVLALGALPPQTASAAETPRVVQTPAAMTSASQTKSCSTPAEVEDLLARQLAASLEYLPPMWWLLSSSRPPIIRLPRHRRPSADLPLGRPRRAKGCHPNLNRRPTVLPINQLRCLTPSVKLSTPR